MRNRLIALVVFSAAAFAAEPSSSVAEAVMHQDQAALRSLIDKQSGCQRTSRGWLDRAPLGG